MKVLMHKNDCTTLFLLSEYMYIYQRMTSRHIISEFNGQIITQMVIHVYMFECTCKISLQCIRGFVHCSRTCFMIFSWCVGSSSIGMSSRSRWELFMLGITSSSSTALATPTSSWTNEVEAAAFVSSILIFFSGGGAITYRTYRRQVELWTQKDNPRTYKLHTHEKMSWWGQTSQQTPDSCLLALINREYTHYEYTHNWFGTPPSFTELRMLAVLHVYQGFM